MLRRDFYKTSSILGLNLVAGKAALAANSLKIPEPGFYNEESNKLPAFEFNVGMAGGLRIRDQIRLLFVKIAK